MPDSAIPWTAAQQASLSNSQRLLKLMSIKSVMSSNHLTLCPFLLLASVFPSIRVFSSESALHIRWPKYWSFSFSISPSDEYSGLISFQIDWFDLLAVQGTLKSLLQHHSLKASILRHSAFFMVQHSPSVHDHWKNYNFDSMDLCRHLGTSNFPPSVKPGFPQVHRMALHIMAHGSYGCPSWRRRPGGRAGRAGHLSMIVHLLGSAFSS